MTCLENERILTPKGPEVFILEKYYKFVEKFLIICYSDKREALSGLLKSQNHAKSQQAQHL